MAVRYPVGHEPAFLELGSEYYRTGIEARRRAHAALADVPGLVDDVEDRIEALLQRTLDRAMCEVHRRHQRLIVKMS